MPQRKILNVNRYHSFSDMILNFNAIILECINFKYNKICLCLSKPLKMWLHKWAITCLLMMNISSLIWMGKTLCVCVACSLMRVYIHTWIDICIYVGKYSYTCPLFKPICFVSATYVTCHSVYICRNLGSTGLFWLVTLYVISKMQRQRRQMHWTAALISPHVMKFQSSAWHDIVASKLRCVPLHTIRAVIICFMFKLNLSCVR